MCTQNKSFSKVYILNKLYISYILYITAGTTTTTVAPPGAPAPTANTSPQFLRCIANCQTTNQYNPVCGTDRQLYNNQARLDCANQCGAGGKNFLFIMKITSF